MLYLEVEPHLHLSYQSFVCVVIGQVQKEIEEGLILEQVGICGKLELEACTL